MDTSSESPDESIENDTPYNAVHKNLLPDPYDSVRRKDSSGGSKKYATLKDTPKYGTIKVRSAGDGAVESEYGQMETYVKDGTYGGVEGYSTPLPRQKSVDISRYESATLHIDEALRLLQESANKL